MSHEVHGSKIREDVVGEAIARLEDYIADHDIHVPNLLRIVDHEIAAAAFGLKYMRISELKIVRNYLKKRIDHG